MAHGLVRTLSHAIEQCLLRQNCARDEDLLITVLASVLGFVMIVILPYFVSFRLGFSKITHLYQTQRNKRRIHPLRIPKRLIQKDSTSGCGEYALRPFPASRSDKDLCPLICLVNPKSGGQMGNELMHLLSKALSPFQVFDIRSDGGPTRILARFIDHSANRFYPCRILVCGGDGTVGWVLSALDTLDCANQPPVAVLPLGTGNDMARTLGWGGGYDRSDDLFGFLADIRKANAVNLDRWKLTITYTNRETSEPATKEVVVNNYFSIGIDASIAKKFHEKREQAPQNFQSRTGNKVVYGMLGVERALLRNQNLGGKVSLFADSFHFDNDDTSGGIPRTRIAVENDWEGLVMANLPNYHGGKNFWGFPPEGSTRGFAPVEINDGRLELMGVTGSLHMAAIHADLFAAHRLAQCTHVSMEIQTSMDMQVDGEPFTIVGPSRVALRPWKRAPMLIRRDRIEMGLSPFEETADETNTETAGTDSA